MLTVIGSSIIMQTEAYLIIWGDLMSLIRWNPVNDILTLQEKVNKLFDDNNDDQSTTHTFTPLVDIIETNNDIKLIIEVAGMKEEDIDIQITDGSVIVKGERVFDEDLNEESSYKLERQYGNFKLSFAVHPKITSPAVSATLKDGLLRIVLRKKIEPNSKSIVINKE